MRRSFTITRNVWFQGGPKTRRGQRQLSSSISDFATRSKDGHPGLDGTGDSAVDDQVGAGDEASSRTE